MDGHMGTSHNVKGGRACAENRIESALSAILRSQHPFRPEGCGITVGIDPERNSGHPLSPPALIGSLQPVGIGRAAQCAPARERVSNRSEADEP
jgi:hypothetical protein